MRYITLLLCAMSLTAIQVSPAMAAPPEHANAYRGAKNCNNEGLFNAIMNRLNPHSCDFRFPWPL